MKQTISVLVENQAGVLNRITSLRYLIIESAFSDAQRDIAGRAGHFHPALLADELNKLQQDAEIYITHLRQNEADITMREILARVSRFDLRRLASNQLFEF